MTEEKKDFVVNDKRVFADEDTAEEIPEEGGGAAEKETGQDEADYQLPAINFPTFIFSLNSSALLNLGAIEDPGTGQKAKNLPLAKQTIDILACSKKRQLAI